MLEILTLSDNKFTVANKDGKIFIVSKDRNGLWYIYDNYGESVESLGGFHSESLSLKLTGDLETVLNGIDQPPKPEYEVGVNYVE